MSDSQLPVPKQLKLDDSSDYAAWQIFERIWSHFEIATGLKYKPKEVRLATFLNDIGDEGLEKYDSLTFADAEDSKDL